MRIGVFVSETWDAPSSVAEVRERARRAEEHGLASGSVPYLPWSLDALASVQAAGEATSRIELGTAVIPTYLFHPLALARQAATVAGAVGRPVALGIGCSNVAVIEMHGLPYERPARHVREYLEVLRAAERSADGQVGYEGEIFRVAGLYGAPGGPPGPVLVGALGPLMLRAAGELADGTLATMSDEVAIERTIGPGVREAARAAGRPEPRVGAVVPVCVDDDLDAARARAVEKFAVYDTMPRYRRMIELGGGEIGADLCLVGGEKAVRERLRRFADAGLTDFLAAPLALGADPAASRARTLACLADAARDL